MGSTYINLFFAVFYVFILSYSIVSDFRTLIIPNWISISLIIGFILYSIYALTFDEFKFHLLIATVGFGFGIGFYAFGWFGGGDVKLLTAAILWAGPSNAVNFLISMAIVGWILAFSLMALRFTLGYLPDLFSKTGFLRHPIKWLEEGVCPYGTAIGAAALVTAPAIFSA